MAIDAFVLAQFGGGGEWWTWILWFVMLMVFMMFYPRIMVAQIMWKLEKTAKDLEDMSEEAKKFVLKEISGRPDKSLRDSVNRFYEFFVIEPVAVDPYGIIKKLDHIIRSQEERFEWFAKQVAPKADSEKLAALQMGFAAGITLYDIAKVVRHFVEMVRKTKNIQIAMILQMQLPMIERIARSMYRGTKTLVKAEPIGDGTGPLMISYLIGNNKAKEIDKDIVACNIKLFGRDTIVMKALGPGGRLGRPGTAVEKIMAAERVSKIITIDAAAKLEGEKTGSVAEGVGVAMGGPGVDRSYIENVAVKQGVPLDSIIVKMSQEEAIMPMRAAIKNAWPQVRDALKRSLQTAKPGKVIIVGVGNSSGVGNSNKELEKLEKWVEDHERKLKEKKKNKDYDFDLLD